MYSSSKERNRVIVRISKKVAFISMLAMLVVATALTRLTLVQTRPSNDDDFNSQLSRRLYSEDDMTPDFTEQLGRYDHDGDIKKRDEEKHEKYDTIPMKNEEKPIAGIFLTNSAAPVEVEEGKKRVSIHIDDNDVVDRADHVTQYLADLLVNTDNEITSLQASDADGERDSLEAKEDKFFAFLTGQEKILEVEGAWSRPVEDDFMNNVIAEAE